MALDISTRSDSTQLPIHPSTLPYEANPKVWIQVSAIHFESGEAKVLTIPNAGSEDEFTCLMGFPLDITQNLETQVTQYVNQLDIFQNFHFFELFQYFEPAQELRAKITIHYACVGTLKQEPSQSTADEANERMPYNWLTLTDWTNVFPSFQPIYPKLLKELCWQLRFNPLLANVLPDEFSLTEAQKIVEFITARKLDVRNFRKRLLGLNILKESPTRPLGVAYRPPRLYRLDQEAYYALLKEQGELKLT
jgi:8-oxo-dGTP diphosphatase